MATIDNDHPVMHLKFSCSFHISPAEVTIVLGFYTHVCICIAANICLLMSVVGSVLVFRASVFSRSPQHSIKFDLIFLNKHSPVVQTTSAEMSHLRPPSAAEQEADRHARHRPPQVACDVTRVAFTSRRNVRQRRELSAVRAYGVLQMVRAWSQVTSQ